MERPSNYEARQAEQAKPVLPHYSPTRRVLQEALTRTNREIDDQQSSLGYHENELMKGREKLAKLKAQSVHIEVAMNALAAMDKSGLIMKAVDQ